jgi:hypothetical protein
VSIDDLPKDVLTFIDERIDSVPHLEVLLILWESGTAWDAQQMSTRVYLQELSTHEVLLDLHRTGLATTSDAMHFSFDTGLDAVSLLMPRLAQTYQHNVRRIATLIHDKPSSSVREFARAFDFKKER